MSCRMKKPEGTKMVRAVFSGSTISRRNNIWE